MQQLNDNYLIAKAENVSQQIMNTVILIWFWSVGAVSTIKGIKQPEKYILHTYICEV